MKFFTRSAIFPFLVCAWPLSLCAQTDSRVAEIEAQQEQKAIDAKPDEPGKVERAFLTVRDHAWVERITAGADGFGPKLGGLAPGTGFGIGPTYRRTDLLNGRLTFRASAVASFRGSHKFEIELAAPKLSGGRYFAEFYSVHHNYPTLGYYGPGPDSQKTGRTDFRLEDTAFDGTFGVRPVRRLAIGGSAGYVLNNIGPGTGAAFASAEKVYSPRQAPGIDAQSNFVRTGGFAQYDWRDNPDSARTGGNYFVQFSDFRDRTFGLSNFRRLDLEAQQFVPILNERRVFAVRAKSALTYSDGHPLPFYMQPSLGGSNDLRGYRAYRFRGDNLFVMNAEYRYEIFSGLDMAVFGDAGQVFTRKSDFSFRNLESDLGFGFRFNQRNKTFLRLDVAFSHEGFEVWVKFSNVFKKGPVHTSSSMGDF
jgi:hypothetical protein